MSLKSSHWSCLKAWFKGYTFCSTFLVRPSKGARRSHERAPKKTFKWPWKSKFRQQDQSFVCVPPWRRVTFKFWEMLKNASAVILTLKKFFFFFLKILNLVQSFVECEVSLTDGNSPRPLCPRRTSYPMVSLATVLYTSSILFSRSGDENMSDAELADATREVRKTSADGTRTRMTETFSRAHGTKTELFVLEVGTWIFLGWRWLRPILVLNALE